MTPGAPLETGKLLDRRKAMLGLAFGSAAALAAWRLPRERLDYLGPQKIENIVPKQIGSWKFAAASGLVVPPEDQLSNALYSQLLTRVYTDEKSAPIMLLVAQSAAQTGVLQIHRPEVCYPAGGYSLSPIVPHAINVGDRVLTTNVLTATSDVQNEHISYWTRVGSKLPLTWAQQRVAVAEQNLRGIIPDAILVRVSTRENDRSVAQQILDEFTKGLLAQMSKANRSVFIG